MRLAWFSPMPPVRSGVAAYSAEIVAGLQAEHDVDVFVDRPPSTSASVRALPKSAHDFVWMHRQRPYDLTVYQLGNSSNQDFLWPYLFRYPGLCVLHDAHLHHARAALLLRERRAGDYRAEFAANEPGVSVDAAELAVAGFDSFLHYEWPFTRLVGTTSRMIAVHSRLIHDDLQNSFPATPLEHIRLGHGTFVRPEETAERRSRGRKRHGIPADALVFGCFGGLTPEKRLPRILEAMPAVLPYAPSAWLLLAGPEAEHYDVRQDVRRRDLESRVIVAGYVDSEEDLTDSISACDVTLNLRWPTAREVSGPWLRCLAAGRASIVVDLSHTADVPSLDPRTWTANGPHDRRPVTVAIDIMDEDHSLRLAMRRLATDPCIRDELGTAAREFWIQEHSHGVMLEDYRRVLSAAAKARTPVPSVPAHILDSHSGVLEHVLGRFGVAAPWSKGVAAPWSKIENPAQR